MKQDLVWGDMDAFQHLNNVAYFRLFESVRIAYFNELGILETMGLKNLGPILHSTDCRYRIPLTYPDALLLGLVFQGLNAIGIPLNMAFILTNIKS